MFNVGDEVYWLDIDYDSGEPVIRCGSVYNDCDEYVVVKTDTSLETALRKGLFNSPLEAILAARDEMSQWIEELTADKNELETLWNKYMVEAEDV